MNNLNEINLLKYKIERIYKKNKKIIKLDNNEKQLIEKCITVNDLKKYRRNLKEFIKYTKFVNEIDENKLIEVKPEVKTTIEEIKPEVKTIMYDIKPIIENNNNVNIKSDFKPEINIDDKIKLFNQNRLIEDLNIKLINYKKIIKQLTTENKKLNDIFNNNNTSDTNSNTTEEEEED
jgi:hypothetical protein